MITHSESLKPVSDLRQACAHYLDERPGSSAIAGSHRKVTVAGKPAPKSKPFGLLVTDDGEISSDETIADLSRKYVPDIMTQIGAELGINTLGYIAWTEGVDFKMGLFRFQLAMDGSTGFSSHFGSEPDEILRVPKGRLFFYTVLENGALESGGPMQEGIELLYGFDKVAGPGVDWADSAVRNLTAWEGPLLPQQPSKAHIRMLHDRFTEQQKKALGL